ncbi:magnesium transporter [Kluyvera sp. STS39-E]|uniref:magnesium transporter n=1 Tax=Kluyvera sp. STS39-E TaxID=3234748 RepID=UPI0034C64CB5
MSHISVPYYPTEQHAGDIISGYMTRDYISLPEHLNVKEARERFLQILNDDHFPCAIFVVAGDSLRGILSTRKLLQASDDNQPLTQLISTTLYHVGPQDDRTIAAELIEKHHLTLLPVIENGKLIGCLNEKEIARLLADEVTEDAQLQGATLPLDKPYLEISPVVLWKKRAVWLLLLFIAEAYTSSVIQHFEEALESAIALAFFIPLLIGTGGNSGTQITSTLVRAMALGEVGMRDLGRILRKEMSTAVLVAITLGTAGCIRAWMMGIGPEITLIVSITLVCVTLWSAVVSSVIPLVIKRLGIDPAVVSAPFIATLIDGTGLIIYFKIAQHFLGLN